MTSEKKTQRRTQSWLWRLVSSQPPTPLNSPSPLRLPSPRLATSVSSLATPRAFQRPLARHLSSLLDQDLHQITTNNYYLARSMRGARRYAIPFRNPRSSPHSRKPWISSFGSRWFLEFCCCSGRYGCESGDRSLVQSILAVELRRIGLFRLMSGGLGSL
ncbi:hypothetical protein KC19_11G057000 [Ceratodon purpureus]|uniref:Uncharacterized protein n=1 Tax=Ceratodon purpureus TaxID=3225 RepID=A0A8T0GDR5_CERPU|nr:hypothetical protein KC19_11G057000 [Ceratodon purpureus]